MFSDRHRLREGGRHARGGLSLKSGPERKSCGVSTFFQLYVNIAYPSQDPSLMVFAGFEMHNNSCRLV